MRRNAVLCAVGLGVACLLVYARALSGYLLADDYTVVGSFWGKGFRYLLGLLTSDEIGGVWKEQFIRPMRPWSLALDGWIWGLDPRGFHLTNLLLHTATSVLIAVLVLRLGGRVLSAWLGSLLFLLHPFNAEVATWVSGRDESLACAGILGALLCQITAQSGGRRRLSLGLSCALFTVSMFAKEYALLLPFAIWAWAWLSPPTEQSRLRSLRDSISNSLPLLGVVALFLALRFLVIGHPLGGYGTGAEAHVTLRPEVLMDSIASFGRELLAPFALYPVAAAALVLGILALVAMTGGGEPRFVLIFFWAVLWPALFLAPTHNLVFSPRHLYISFAGMAIAFGLLLARVGEEWMRRVALPIGGALAVLLTPTTLTSVEGYTAMSSRCRRALSSIELATRSFSPGDVVVLVGMPAHQASPWGFGWSLEGALRPPFVEEAIDSRFEVVVRRLWRPEAWAAYRARYPGRGIHVLSWNRAFDGMEFLRDASR